MAWDDVPVGAWSRQRAGSGAQGTGAGQGRGRPGSGGPWVLGCGARTRREGGDASQTLEQTSIMAMRLLLLLFLKHFWRQHGRKSWEGQRWGKPGGAAQGVVGVWGLVTGPRGGPGVPGCRRGRAREEGTGRHTAFVFGDAETCRVRGATAGPGQLRPLTAPARQAGSGGPTRGQHGGPQTPHDASVAARGTGCLPLLETSTK